MKKIFIFFMLSFFGLIFGQLSPTLGVGLEMLTFNKGTIDVKVLTEIIVEKQKELKKEALKRFMYKMFPNTDYTTRFYVQNSLNILLNEKKPQVIEKEIMELTTNYAIALGVTRAYIVFDNQGSTVSNIIINDEWISFLKGKCEQKKSSAAKADNNQIYNNQPDVRFDYKNIYIQLNSKAEKKKDRFCSLYDKFDKYNKEFNNAYLDGKYAIAERKLKYRDKKLNKIKTIAFRNNITPPFQKETDVKVDAVLSFGQNLDLVSKALSSNEKLKKKGFFKNKIDYRDEQSFFISEKEDTKKIEKIDSIVSPYIDNYDIIKTFLGEVKVTGTDNIIEQLKKKYIDQLEYDSIDKLIDNDQNKLPNLSQELSVLLSLKNDLIKLRDIKVTVIENVPITDLIVTDNLVKQIIDEQKNIKKILESINEKSINLKLNNILNIKISIPENKIITAKNKASTITDGLEKIKKLKDAILETNNENVRAFNDSVVSVSNEYVVNAEFIAVITNNKNVLTGLSLEKILKEIDEKIEIKNDEIARTDFFSKFM